MKILKASWQSPENISAVTTLRTNGYSNPPYDSNNLALHVGDNKDHVVKNRMQLTQKLNLPAEPFWLEQIHSNECIIAGKNNSRKADAAISRYKEFPLVVMSADCLPLTVSNKQGTEIAVIHAGWRGLLNGVIHNTISKLNSKKYEIIVWVGPAICQNCYEVGDEVYTLFTNKLPFCDTAFKRKKGKWYMDLSRIAELILQDLGIDTVFQSNTCTYEHENEYYSYRRNPQTGRIATLVWFNELT